MPKLKRGERIALVVAGCAFVALVVYFLATFPAAAFVLIGAAAWAAFSVVSLIFAVGAFRGASDRRKK